MATARDRLLELGYIAAALTRSKLKVTWMAIGQKGWAECKSSMTRVEILCCEE